MTKTDVLKRVNVGELIEGFGALGIAVSELNIHADAGNVSTISVRGCFVKEDEEDEE